MADSQSSDIFYDTVSEIDDISAIDNDECQENRMNQLEHRVNTIDSDTHILKQTCSVIEDKIDTVSYTHLTLPTKA